jgi:hypothetical protein
LGIVEMKRIGIAERIMMRSIPLRSLSYALKQMASGESHATVCATLGIDPLAINGTLKPAIQEALWERGHLR